jgi:hypothetical protein
VEVRVLTPCSDESVARSFYGKICECIGHKGEGCDLAWFLMIAGQDRPCLERIEEKTHGCRVVNVMLDD